MPNYQPETIKTYRADQLTKARVNDQLGFSKLDAETWWKEPLAALGGRTPDYFWSLDPLAVFLCAKFGIARDSESCQEPEEVVSFTPDIAEDLIGEAALVIGQPVTVTSDSRVPDTVSADELDALRSSPIGQSSESVVPDWWT